VLYKLLSSYITLTLLFLLLAVGAAIATFIENDFGTASVGSHQFAEYAQYVRFGYERL